MTKRYMLMLLTALLSVLTVEAASVSPRRFRIYTSANGLADNSAQTIHCTRTGRLVITTMGQINFYNGSTFTYIDPIEENVYSLSDYQGNYHLYFDKYHHMWLKNNHSVTCVDLLVERFAKSIEDVFREFGVSEPVNDLFVDESGVVWLLTQNGLYSVATKKYIMPRKNLNLQDVELYKRKFVMLFYENGLMDVYDMATGKKVSESRPYPDMDARRYDVSSRVLSDSTTNRVFQVRNGVTDGILLAYHMDSKEWKEMLRVPYHLNGLTKRDSLIYVPCEQGYWLFNLNNGEMDHMETVILDSGVEMRTDINVITFDKQGGMWAGTDQRGLLYSMPYKPPFTAYPMRSAEASKLGAMLKQTNENPRFRNRRVNCVFKDSRGWTWVGTPQGLQVYRRESDMLPQVFTTKDGLYNNIVHSITEDRLHRIWVSTSYGISVVLFKENGHVHYINSYNQYDHVPNEVFVNGKAACLPDGRIVMQSLDHMVLFNPEIMTTLDSDYPFKVYPKLIKLLVNGIDVHPGTEIDGKVILDKALSRVGELNLNYDQNSLTLTFSALNYFRPQQTFYRVRMLGLDDEWRVMSSFNSGGMVDKNGLLHLPLMALQPGSYVLQIQSSLAPDVWDTEPYEWIINVSEPWWRTTGMFAGLAVVLLVLLFVNLYYYMRNANLRAQRNSEESGLIKRIYQFVERCNSHTEILEPGPEEYSADKIDPQLELEPEFMAVFKKIVPLVEVEKKKKMTMRRLSNAAGVDGKTFYSLITANIYKSPHSLIKQARLLQAERMLRNTKAPIDVVAKECGFVSANYFIGSFFQMYHVTPEQYRRKR